MPDYWLYVPYKDEAGCVQPGATPEEALKEAEKSGWFPDDGDEIQWYELGEGGVMFYGDD